MKIKLGTFRDQELEKRQLKVLIRNNWCLLLMLKKGVIYGLARAFLGHEKSLISCFFVVPLSSLSAFCLARVLVCVLNDSPYS